MSKLSFIELIFRAIPDAILFIIGAHVFSSTPIIKHKVLKSVLGVAIAIYAIRMLPISYGIHTLLGSVCIILVATLFHNIEVTKAVQGVILTILIQFLTELVNISWIQIWLKQDLEVIFTNPYTKVVYGVPSLLMTASIIALYYVKVSKRKVLKSDGE